MSSLGKVRSNRDVGFELETKETPALLEEMAMLDRVAMEINLLLVDKGVRPGYFLPSIHASAEEKLECLRPLRELYDGIIHASPVGDADTFHGYLFNKVRYREIPFDSDLLAKLLGYKCTYVRDSYVEYSVRFRHADTSFSVQIFGYWGPEAEIDSRKAEIVQVLRDIQAVLPSQFTGHLRIGEVDIDPLGAVGSDKQRDATQCDAIKSNV